jgi:hypothetical protein
MINKIEVSSQDVRKCLNFAWKICDADSQSSTDFGRTDLKRDFQDRFADCVEGKISECAFGKFAFDNFKREFGFDFSIYPSKNVTDYGQDIECVMKGGFTFKCCSKIDVKATRMFSKWLLVERKKFIADAFVLVKVDFPHDIEYNIESLRPVAGRGVKTEIVGFAYSFDFLDKVSKEPLFRFSQGDKLYNPSMFENKDCEIFRTSSFVNKKISEACSTGSKKEIGYPLKANENFGLPTYLLRSGEAEWKDFFDWIENSSFIENEV